MLLYNIVEIGADLPSKVEWEVLVVLPLPHSSSPLALLSITGTFWTKIQTHPESTETLC